MHERVARCSTLFRCVSMRLQSSCSCVGHSTVSFIIKVHEKWSKSWFLLIFLKCHFFMPWNLTTYGEKVRAMWQISNLRWKTKHWRSNWSCKKSQAHWLCSRLESQNVGGWSRTALSLKQPGLQHEKRNEYDCKKIGNNRWESLQIHLIHSLHPQLTLRNISRHWLMLLKDTCELATELPSSSPSLKGSLVTGSLSQREKKEGK